MMTIAGPAVDFRNSVKRREAGRVAGGVLALRQQRHQVPELFGAETIEEKVGDHEVEFFRRRRPVQGVHLLELDPGASEFFRGQTPAHLFDHAAGVFKAGDLDLRIGAQQFRQQVPHGEIVTFDRSGHFAQLEQPDQYAQAVTNFVRQAG